MLLIIASMFYFDWSLILHYSKSRWTSNCLSFEKNWFQLKKILGKKTGSRNFPYIFTQPPLKIRCSKSTRNCVSDKKCLHIFNGASNISESCYIIYKLNKLSVEFLLFTYAVLEYYWYLVFWIFSNILHQNFHVAKVYNCLSHHIWEEVASNGVPF